MDPKMEEQNKALNVLVAGVRLAQSRGSFTLEQSADLLAAIKIFEVQAPPPGPEAAEAAPAPVA